MVANVNYGLLEKGTNKAHKSFIFGNLNEALATQATYRGNINILSKKLISIFEGTENDALDYDLKTKTTT